MFLKKNKQIFVKRYKTQIFQNSYAFLKKIDKKIEYLETFLTQQITFESVGVGMIL